MRRFEEQYRLQETDDILRKEDAIHQDLDLRLDAVEQLGKAFAEGNRADIEALIAAYRDTVSGLARQVEDLLGEAQGGISAEAIAETADRLFLTAARRAAILSDLRGDVADGGDTLAKVYAVATSRATASDVAAAVSAGIAVVKGTADAAHDTLGELAGLIDAVTVALATKADASALDARLRGDASGGYAVGVQDRFRTNIAAPVAKAVNAATQLVETDFDRDVYATGTATITAASGANGNWRSGVIVNDNLLTGLITLAVPAGASLDGVQNGTTILFPFQRARIRQIAAGFFRTDWVDRTPIVATISASGVVSADATLPAGYSRFAIEMSGIGSTVNADGIYFRVSDNGAAGVKGGTNDYVSLRMGANASSTSAGAAQNTGSAALLFASIGNTYPSKKGLGRFTFSPASCDAIGIVQYYDSTGGNVVGEYAAGYSGGTSGAVSRINLIRFLAGTGALSGNFTIRGEP